jgi:hypothetical protein
LLAAFRLFRAKRFRRLCQSVFICGGKISAFFA